MLAYVANRSERETAAGAIILTGTHKQTHRQTNKPTDRPSACIPSVIARVARRKQDFPS